MKRFFLFFLFVVCVGDLFSQTPSYCLHLFDKMVQQHVAGARILITDTLGMPITSGFSSSAGTFCFATGAKHVIIQADSIPETCDGSQMNFRRRFSLDTVRDTLHLFLMHIWTHNDPRAIVFREGELAFTAMGDSLYSVFDTIRKNEPGYRAMEPLIENYKCGSFSKVELVTYYTSREDAMYGDSLALVRASLVANYLKTHGLNDVGFIFTPILYTRRPFRRADGEFQKEEMSFMYFRIVAW